MKKVSIVTITFNSEDTIKDTMMSVLRQNYRPLQYVLIDGASTDHTYEIIQNMYDNFKNAGIDIISISEPDKGISDAFNKGIKLSYGEVIGIINAGDMYSRDAVSSVMSSDWDNLDFLCGNVLWKDKENELEYIRKSNLKWDKLKYEMTVMHPSCFVKKQAYEECGGFNTDFKYAMDYDLVCRFWRMKRKMLYIPVVLAEMSAGGVSDTSISKIEREIADVNKNNRLTYFQIVTHWQWVRIRHAISSELKKRKLFKK